MHHTQCLAMKGCGTAGCPLERGPGAGGSAGSWAPEAVLAAARARPRARRASEDANPTVPLLVALGLALLVALVATGCWLVMRPQARAARAYSAGVQALRAGDAQGAALRMELALQYEPQMAEAALCLGFARLGFAGQGFSTYGLTQLFEDARWGRTSALDGADEAFRYCVSAASGRPADAPVRSLFAATVQEMIAVAWIGQALTALLRAAAAVDTAHPDQAQQWIAVAWANLDTADAVYPRAETRPLREIAVGLQGGQ